METVWVSGNASDVAYPKRGEVWWVACDPAVGGEIKKTRPAVIISNNASNKYLNRVQAVPLTSRVDKLYPAECYIQLGDVKSKAIASQVVTASKQRLKSKLTTLKPAQLAELEAALRIQLGL